MLQLNDLSRLVKKRKRVGRGGERGGTSGKGNKGQKARSGGYVRRGFEGGQMPLIRRLPKRGFSNVNFRADIKVINLNVLNNLFAEGEVVTKALLIEKGVLKGKSDFLLKVLGSGTLAKKLIVHADAFSASDVKMISDLGGEARVIKEI
jgi:large subunit ribosomal protein L15